MGIFNSKSNTTVDDKFTTRRTHYGKEFEKTLFDRYVVQKDLLQKRFDDDCLKIANDAIKYFVDNNIYGLNLEKKIESVGFDNLLGDYLTSKSVKYAHAFKYLGSVDRQTLADHYLSPHEYASQTETAEYNYDGEDRGGFILVMKDCVRLHNIDDELKKTIERNAKAQMDFDLYQMFEKIKLNLTAELNKELRENVSGDLNFKQYVDFKNGRIQTEQLNTIALQVIKKEEVHKYLVGGQVKMLMNLMSVKESYCYDRLQQDSLQLQNLMFLAPSSDNM